MFEADMLAAIRRLRRRLSLWRTLAVVAVVAALAAVFWGRSGGEFSAHVARVRVSGLITGAQRRIDLLDRLAKEGRVKAVIVRIDSPGGTTAGSEAIYAALRRIARKKPVAAVMDSVAASGGYIAALAADRIFARGNTITGSIGVIFQWAEFAGLMDRVGVKMRTVRSGPLKAEPNPFTPLRPEVRKVTEELVRDSFRWFVALVAGRRHMSPQQAEALADGRVYTGRQAVKNGLVDALGDERDALKWLQTSRGISKSLKIVERKPKKLTSGLGWGLSLARAALALLGLERLLPAQGGSASERFALDGLVSVWHPAP